MKAFAEYNDYEIAGEYEDAGKSGKSIEGRVEFARMMEDIKSGKDGISFVLVFKLSRFGRNAAIEAEKITGDNIYKVLIYFDRLYKVMNDVEKRQLMESLVSEIQIFEDRQPNSQWLKSIEFKLPIIEEDMEVSLDDDEHVEAMVILSQRKPDD